MDQDKLRELNNQTNNLANEKWTPGAKNGTTEGPPDHTYPKGASEQKGEQAAEDWNMRQSGSGSGDMPMRDADSRSMQNQPSGGTGATQGVTDSHQRQMEQRSRAYGTVEGQPLGQRPSGSTQATHDMNPQDPRQPELKGGAPGGRHGNMQSSTQGGGQHGPLSDVPMRQGGSMGGQQSAVPQGTQGGGQPGRNSGTPSVQRTGSLGTEAGGASEQRDTGGVHESNDLTGGLPRSPGNSGPRPDTEHRGTGPWNEAERLRVEGGVHESNDLNGGLPRSPGGANKLRADEKMDDDTGFSNRGL